MRVSPPSLVLVALAASTAIGACRSTLETPFARSSDAQARTLVETPAQGSPRARSDDGNALFAAPGTKAELGQPAPNFTLKDLAGNEVQLASLHGKTIVLEWFSPVCPFTKHAHDTGPLKTLPVTLKRQNVAWIAINSESAENEGSNPKLNEEFVAKYGMKVTLLFDPSGDVGREYGAKSTPHLFVINERGKLVYRGALDNAPLGIVSGDVVKTNYVTAAISDLKAGYAVTTRETRAYGTPIRYSKPQR